MNYHRILERAPNDDPFNYDVDKDYCYYWFNGFFELLSSLDRTVLCSGNVNAKSHFPRDYESYFKDDALASSLEKGQIISIIEPWLTPNIDTFVYTLKTSIKTINECFMLGCFSLVDDVILGISKFRLISLH